MWQSCTISLGKSWWAKLIEDGVNVFVLVIMGYICIVGYGTTPRDKGSLLIFRHNITSQLMLQCSADG